MLPRGAPLNNRRDGYIHAFTNDEFYTASGFERILKEFLEMGFELTVSGQLGTLGSVRNPQLREPTLEELAAFGIKQ
ncbi:MAG: hypothetical protein AABX00_00090 [Nanoarchaeota archaeon]